jgi:hypothetical protein
MQNVKSKRIYERGAVSSLGSQLIGGASFSEINWWKVGIGAMIGGVADILAVLGRETRQHLILHRKCRKQLIQ